MRLLLIMNPGSRCGRGKRLWRVWQEGLRAARVPHEPVQTSAPGHAFELARVAGDFDAVVAVGGDGTVNEVLDGIMQSDNPQRAMGVLYCGTSPDFCRFHGIPTDPRRALAVLLAGKTRQADVVRITHHNQAGSEQVAHFGCSCNIGMGAAVARFSNLWRRLLGDFLGTAAAVVHSLLAHKPVDLELVIDGETRRLAKTNNLTIVKNPHIASGLRLDLDLRPDDGRLYVVGVSGKSRAAMLAAVPKFYSGSITSGPNVLVKPCRSVTVCSRVRQEIEFDGDPRGFLPARTEILPRALHLIGDAHE